MTNIHCDLLDPTDLATYMKMAVPRALYDSALDSPTLKQLLEAEKKAQQQFHPESETYFILYEDDKPIGITMMRQEGEHNFHFGGTFLLQEYRRRNLSKYLYAARLDHIQENHPDAQTFNMRIDFKKSASLKAAKNHGFLPKDDPANPDTTFVDYIYLERPANIPTFAI